MFHAWSIGEVAERKAGTLVRMAEGQSVTFKLTNRPRDMFPVECLPDWIREKSLQYAGYVCALIYFPAN